MMARLIGSSLSLRNEVKLRLSVIHLRSVAIGCRSLIYWLLRLVVYLNVCLVAFFGYDGNDLSG